MRSLLEALALLWLIARDDGEERDAGRYLATMETHRKEAAA